MCSPGSGAGDRTDGGRAGDLCERPDLQHRADPGIVDLDDTVDGKQLAVPQRVLGGLDHVGAHVAVGDVCVHPLGRRLLLHALLEPLHQLDLRVGVGKLPRCALEALVVPDPVESDRLDPSREEVRLGEGVHDPALVLALHEHAGERHLARIPVVRERVDRVGNRFRRGRLILGELLAVAQQPADLRVLAARDRHEHVRIDPLPPSGEFARPQRREDSLHREHPGEVRAVGARSKDRPFPVALPTRLVAEDPRLRHDERVVGLDVCERTGVPEAGDRAADQRRIDAREVGVAHARFLGPARAPVFDDDVEAGHETEHLRPAGRSSSDRS